ncbi:MAG: cation:proton antiporter [Candidatus Kerfeldbacteria bacterium]|nr:cation:proton antiporter [Candidatus Kerfeldbacteria bacterium]
MITDGITELALLLSLTAVVGMVARVLKQPMILAYLVVGMMIAGVGLVNTDTRPIYQTFSELGVTLLLFMVGLEINVGALRRIGWAAIILGLGQIVFTFVGGFFIGIFLQLTPLSAAYIAMALTFSSTVVVVKLLSERQDINSLYGKLSLGILLVQDIVAILLLVILASVRDGATVSAGPLVLTIGQAILLFLFAFWLGRSIIPQIFSKIAHSEELLFLSSLAWVFALAAIVRSMGLSTEIGGFLAGIALANSSTHYQIASRIRPLRDFFIVLFFIVLGSSIVLTNMAALTGPILVYSLFVLVGNPVIVLIIMGWMGYHRRTSFLTGITVAQISEFSLILASLGLSLGHIDQQDVTIITAVGIITIAVSSYMIMHGDRLYGWLEPVVSFFHRSQAPSEGEELPMYSRPILLIGAHRVGQNIATSLGREELVIIDDDPDVVADLQARRYRVLFGDVSDHDILKHIDFRRVRLVISTVPNMTENLNLIEYLRSQKRKPRLVIRGENDADTAQLYAAGVDYVFRPHLTAGHLLGQAIARDIKLKHLDQLRRHDQRLVKHLDTD